MSLLTKAKKLATTKTPVKARNKETGEIITGLIKILNGKGACFVWKDTEKGSVFVRLSSRTKNSYSFINAGVVCGHSN